MSSSAEAAIAVGMSSGGDATDCDVALGSLELQIMRAVDEGHVAIATDATGVNF